MAGTNQTIRYAAFLRAINVGKRRVTMDALRAAVEDLGFGDAATLIASGNVAFTDSTGQGAETVARRLDDGLTEALGFPVASALRSAEDVAAIVARMPFDDEPWDEADVLHVSFLLGSAPDGAVERIAALSTPDDRFLLGERELYWRRRGRLTASAVEPKVLAKALGVDATARRMDTVAKMLPLLDR